MKSGKSPPRQWHEVLVMILIVARALWALRGPFRSEPKGLVFLTVCSLCVEFASTSGMKLRSWNVRATPAPGIFLGALTIPIVMGARLIQVFRSPHHTQLGLERARLGFWSSITCSVALLLLLGSSIMWQSEKHNIDMLNGRSKKHKDYARKLGSYNQKQNANSVYSTLGLWNLCKERMTGVLLLAVVLVLLLGRTTGIWGCMWCLTHALGTASLFDYLLRVFPFCSSAGEAMLVAQGLALYAGNMIFFTLSRTILSHFLPRFMVEENLDPIDAIVQALVLGLLMVPFLYKYLSSKLSLRVLEISEKAGVISEDVSKAGLFYSTVFFMVLWGAPVWLQFVPMLSEHPILWILHYVFEEPQERLGLCLFWILAVGVFSLLLHRMAIKNQVARIILRKGFHLLAVIMFVPALALQPGFLRLAFALALAVFLLVEMVRVWRIPPFGERIHAFLKAFTDGRDSDILIISHFSLLLGCAVPVWLCTRSFVDRPLAPYAGILSLGIGDTMASVVGYNYGSLRLSRSSKKTVEGTVASISSMVAASFVLLYFVSATALPAAQVCSLVIASVGAGLIEAYTSQLDNAFVPLLYYALLSM